MKWRAFEPSSGGKPIDPYLAWAELTGYRSFTSNRQFQPASGTQPGPTWASVIAKARDEAALRALLRNPPPWLQLPPIYGQPLPGSVALPLHFTARVPVSDLLRLQTLDGIERWELGLPVRAPQGVLGDALSEPAPAVDVTPAAAAAKRARRGSTRRMATARPLVGVVDYGCAVFNERFCSDGNAATRIVRLWDQNEGPGETHGRWRAVSAFGYGRCLGAAEIDAVLAERAQRDAAGRGRDELADYAAIGYLHEAGDRERPIKRRAHGTHVLDVAAGRDDPWTGRPDAASRAALAFVQLPVETVVDSSGGSLAVHLLDGVRDILALADVGAAVVVIVSQGTHAGPHDGSSLIECALDELLALRSDNFALVVAAGNAGMAAYPVRTDGHARADVSAAGEVVFEIDVPDGDTTDSFVELWYPAGTGAELHVALCAPGEGAPPHFVAAGGCARGDEEGEAVAALVHCRHTPLGRGHQVLAALAPSGDGAHAPWYAQATVTPGRWALRVRNSGSEAVTVDAYVERDDPLRGAPAVWPHFAGRHVAQDGTLNTLATGAHTLVAGALRRDDGEPSAYASRGPVRGGPRAAPGRSTPDVLAAADESTALPGVRAAATRNAESWRMSGTSVAAPTLARRLMNLMCAAPAPIKRADWPAVLQRLAKEPGSLVVHPPD